MSKSKWDGVTVYTSESEGDEDGESIARYSLHPFPDSLPMGEGGQVGFRVLWHWSDMGTVMPSCRGGAHYTGTREYCSRCGSDEWDNPKCGPRADEEFPDEQSAFQWLVDGEDDEVSR